MGRRSHAVVQSKFGVQGLVRFTSAALPALCARQPQRIKTGASPGLSGLRHRRPQWLSEPSRERRQETEMPSP